MAITVFVLMLLVGIWFLDAATLIEQIVHLPQIPFWLNVAIALGLLSWLIKD